MINNIVLGIGTFASRKPLIEFCSQKQQELHTAGIDYPESLEGVILPEGRNQDLLGLLGTGVEAHALVYHLQCVRETVLASFPRPRTLFLFWHLWHHFTDRLVSLQAACRKVFPGARQKALLCFARQDIEQEVFANSYYLLYKEPLFAIWQRQSCSMLPHYPQCLRFLFNAFGRANVHCSIPTSGIPAYKSYINSLCDTLELTPEQAVDLEVSSFQSGHDFLLPREVLHFAAATNWNRLPPAMPGTVSRWSFQAESFSPGNGYESSPHSLLGPSMRAELLTEFAQSNAEAAAMLGLPRLFDAPAHEPDWQPWFGLTPDTAYSIAERLDTNFVQDLLLSFSKLPTHEQGRDQRIVHQALLEVSTPAYVSPPPRRFGEQPAKVAVLTLAHNHEDCIEQNIKSVIAQKTSFPIEHIIADDGSDDETQKIVATYAKQYPHIVPFFQEKDNLRINNVQALFEMARSPYVALCDGDDYFCNPHKLQKQVDFLDAHPRYSICCHPVHMIWENKRQQDRVFPQGEEIPPHGQPYTLTDLVRWNFMSTSSVMYRWRFRGGLPNWFFLQALPGDWYWHILHAEQGRIGMLPEVMSVYRRHDKGVWRYAETDLVKHKRTYGLKELRTYIEIDRHLKGRFKNILSKTILWEFYMLFEMAVKHNEPELFEQAVKEFPEWADEVLETIETSRA
ncbi:glycosyltransferase [Desulfovibrio sp. OttesenSCG-928-M14]|nr:glycosyltransferase [Desulfovibrio sp. OttesenSCG-928-M14]